MEDYEYKVGNYMQLYPMNISKFTGNSSKNTSEFASETDQIKVRGAMVGPTPSTKPLPDRIVAPRSKRPLLY